VTTVEVKGLKELRDALVRKIPIEMQGKVLQKALAPAARLTVNRAKQLVPVATGRMRKAIYATKDRKSSKPTYEARVITVRRGKKRSDLRGAYYWKFVEFGHKAGKTMVPAQPFIRPAFEATKNAALESIRLNLGKAIEAAAQKAKF
jgi:HK97 gp10 family phage protein